jgi:hypothetical protein
MIQGLSVSEVDEVAVVSALLPFANRTQLIF